MGKIIDKIIAFLADTLGWDKDSETPLQLPKTPPEGIPLPQAPQLPDTEPEPVKITVMADPYLTSLVPWTNPKNNFHNVRVLCDRSGLTTEQKNIVCECIYQESQFYNYLPNGEPVTNKNKDPKTGEVWSTDYGLLQVNDHYNIGPGKRFPSVEYVMQHPEKPAQWMIDTIKSTGRLQPWSSFTSGAYKKWGLSNSPMWKLRT